MITISAYGT